MIRADTDVVIIGAGPAGLSAALNLARARRRVMLIDSNRPRNSATLFSHGYLTRDGITPHELRHLGRKELTAYSGVEHHLGHVERVSRVDGGVRVERRPVADIVGEHSRSPRCCSPTEPAFRSRAASCGRTGMRHSTTPPRATSGLPAPVVSGALRWQLGRPVPELPVMRATSTYCLCDRKCSWVSASISSSLSASSCFASVRSVLDQRMNNRMSTGTSATSAMNHSRSPDRCWS